MLDTGSLGQTSLSAPSQHSDVHAHTPLLLPRQLEGGWGFLTGAWAAGSPAPAPKCFLDSLFLNQKTSPHRTWRPNAEKTAREAWMVWTVAAHLDLSQSGLRTPWQACGCPLSGGRGGGSETFQKCPCQLCIKDLIVRSGWFPQDCPESCWAENDTEPTGCLVTENRRRRNMTLLM